uniref:Uncharacterized protein n=1 Tax=Sinocyclocheilus anshuiensis TaxID=1608454 RepID=A0A671SIS6_9TELE
MAGSSGVMDGGFMKHAEYTPKSSGQNETDIDKRLGLLIIVTLTVHSHSRYAFHLWRPLSQVITEATKKLPTAVSVRNKQTIFNIHPKKKKKQGTKAKRYIFVAYLPINGGSPYLAAKINEAKDLLDSGPRR